MKRFKLIESQSWQQKRASEKALNLNGGNDEAYLEIFALNESTDFASCANRTFAKVLRSLQKFRRTQMSSRHYRFLALKKRALITLFKWRG